MYSNVIQFTHTHTHTQDFPDGSVVKKLPVKQQTRVWSLDREDPLEKEMATHCCILVWKIPWTEQPGGYSSRGCKKSDRTKGTLHAHKHMCTQERSGKGRESVTHRGLMLRPSESKKKKLGTVWKPPEVWRLPSLTDKLDKGWKTDGQGSQGNLLHHWLSAMLYGHRANPRKPGFKIQART